MARTPFRLATIHTDFDELEGEVSYGMGKKAPENPFFKYPSALLKVLRRLDCSGLVRLLAFRSSSGKSNMPDGSQVQLAWCQKKALDPASGVREVDYEDAVRYCTPTRLFICFLKPFTNGCGKTGHVWFLLMRSGQVVTIESHFGRGANSRPWDTDVLKEQVFACFELPTI